MYHPEIPSSSWLGHTKNYLQNSINSLEMAFVMAKSSAILMNDTDTIRKYLWAQISSNKDISLNYFGFPDGSFIG